MGWINLAKIYYGNPSKEDRELLNKIINASEKGTAIFPISMVNLQETSTISKPQWRQQLSSLMVSISKGYAITPYWPYILDLEIQNLVLKKLGLPQRNIRKIWLGKGISHLIGERPSVVSKKKIDPTLLKKLEKDILDKLEDPKTLELLLSDRYDKKAIKQDEIDTIKEFEKNRNNLSKIKNNDLRFKCFLFQNITATIAPKLIKTLINLKLPPEFLKEIFPKGDIETFLMNIPTALCEFTLLFQRDQQLQRPIEVNDIDDVWHLTLAIPYSDIVVTEKMWTSISKRTKLDKKCNTIILSSIRELDKYL